MGKRIVLVLLIMSIFMGCMGCGQPKQDNSVIAQRRDAAEQYMRKMATYVWRAQEDITYTRSNNILTDEDLASYTGMVLKIKAGRLYRGLPYSYSGGSAWNFYDYASEPDAKGIPTVTGFHWRSLNGGSSTGSYLGNDCSGAVQLAWDYVGSSIQLATTEYMVKNCGYLPVGQYESDETINKVTTDTCNANGVHVMLAAYACLQKADAVVRRGESSGHTMMVVENHPVKNGDSYDLNASYITVLHQTSAYMKNEQKSFDEAYGEDVYTIYGIDEKITYANLFNSGYLPITCDVFQDPSPVEEVYVKDSESEHSFDNILKGQFSSNRILSAATITITDENGKVVMEGTCYERRQTKQDVFTFDMERFTSQMPEMQHGSVTPEALPSGNYHCTHVVRDAHGVSYTMRDFDFIVP